MSSNYSTILVDSVTNQLRYLAPIHQFQNWGPNQNPSNPLSNIISQINSCNVMTIRNSFVGIGTVDPRTQLYIVQGASNAITVDGNRSTTGITIVADSSQCNVGVSLIHDQGSNAFLLNKSGNIYIRNGYSNQGIFIDRFNNVTVGGNVNTSNLFSVIGGGVSIGYSNANRAGMHSMIVAGSVSIGTVSSTNTLNVNGSASITSNVAFGSIFTTASNVGINTTAVQNTLTVAGNLAVGAYSNISGPTMGAIISGNVGIGTALATNTLNIAGGTAIGSYVTSTAPVNGLIVSGNVGIGTIYNGNMLSVAGTTVIGSYARNANSITNSDSLIVSGNIGIGSTNPQYKLDVNGSAVIGNTLGNLSAATNGLSVYGNVGIGSQLSSIGNLLTIGGNVSIGYTSTVPLAPTNGLIILGRIGVGHPTGTAPGNLIDVNGSMSIGSGFYGTTAPADCLIVSGNIGVGTVIPRAKLHVIGTSVIGIGDTTTTSNMSVGETLNVSGISTLFRTNIQNTSVNTILTPALSVTQNTGGVGSIADFFDSSTSTPILRIGGGGVVAVGGAIGDAGTYSMNVNGQLNSKNLVNTTTATVGFATNAATTPAANGLLVFGNVGIGTSTTPANNLSVYGSIGIGTTYYGINAPTDSLIVGGNIGVGTANPTSRLHIVGPANIGVGNTTTVNNLVVTGNINVTGLTTIANTVVTETDVFSICNLSAINGPGLRVRQNTGNSVAIADFVDITGNPNNTIPVLRVDANNRVGVGTLGTGNAYTLTVNGQTVTNNMIIGYATNAVTTTPTNNLLVNGQIGIGTTNSPGSKLGVYGSVGIGSGYYTSIAPTDSLIVSGNIGVGTNNPTKRLEVAGDANIGIGFTTQTGYILSSSASNTGTLTVDRMVTMSNVTIVNNTPNTLSTPALRITQNTNNSGSVADFFDSTVSTSIPLLRVKNNKTVVIGDGDGTNSYTLVVNGSIQAASGLSVTSGSVSGSVPAANLIGTGTLPLTVIPTVTGPTGTIGTTISVTTNQSSYIIPTIDAYGRITTTTTQTITSSQWIGPGAAATPLIYFNGIVGIGTPGDGVSTFNTPPGTSTNCYLFVDGDIYAAGDIIALSDEKYKKDLEVIQNPIEKIKQVSGYTYTRTDTGNRQTGVIAQELEKVLPEAVQTDANGDKSVAYGNVIGLLIECIKDQQRQIDDLRTLIK